MMRRTTCVKKDAMFIFYLDGLSEEAGLNLTLRPNHFFSSYR